MRILIELLFKMNNLNREKLTVLLDDLLVSDNSHAQ